MALGIMVTVTPASPMPSNSDDAPAFFYVRVPRSCGGDAESGMRLLTGWVDHPAGDGGDDGGGGGGDGDEWSSTAVKTGFCASLVDREATYGRDGGAMMFALLCFNRFMAEEVEHAILFDLQGLSLGRTREYFDLQLVIERLGDGERASSGIQGVSQAALLIARRAEWIAGSIWPMVRTSPAVATDSAEYAPQLEQLALANMVSQTFVPSTTRERESQGTRQAKAQRQYQYQQTGCCSRSWWWRQESRKTSLPRTASRLWCGIAHSG